MAAVVLTKLCLSQVRWYLRDEMISSKHNARSWFHATVVDGVGFTLRLLHGQPNIISVSVNVHFLEAC